MAPFRIDLSSILGGPGESLAVQGEALLEPFEKGGTSVEFAEPPKLHLVVENVGDSSFVARGTLEAYLALTCGRCLKPFEYPVHAAVEAVFASAKTAEEETYRIEGHWIDLMPALMEALVLEVPFAPVCSEDCKGLCPCCGADLAEGPCGCGADRPDPRLTRLADWPRPDKD